MIGLAGPPAMRRFGWLYAIANLGAFVCFIPLIGLLLPQKAMALSRGGDIALLSWILLGGAVAASLANIVAGWVSDRTMQRHASRLPMVGVGLAATLASLATLAAAQSAGTLFSAFLLFQLCFNLLFAPFNALATDYIPDAMKGRMFGLLSLALPLSQIAIIAIVALDVQAEPAAFALIAAVATVTILPLLLFGRAAACPPLATGDAGAEPAPALAPSVLPSRDFALAWSGRLLIQCAAVAASSYMLVHLVAIAGRDPRGGSAESWFSQLSMIALVVGLAVGVAVGRWSDRATRRRPFLWVSALLVAAGCAALAMADSWPVVVGGYALFAIGLTGFLTIDGAVIAQIVGKGGHRAARLGIMNLTNTLPSLMVPGLVLMIDGTRPAAIAALFLCVAVGALIAAVLASMIRSVA